MTLPLLAALVVAVLVAGYAGWGRLVARRLAVDAAATTPAAARSDGVDYVPTRPFYLFGQHFSAIAAAGPIVGPILACQQFGWLPCVLWIALGVVLVGAVHDFAALVASVRHGAASVVEIVRRNLSRRAWAAFLGFLWLALVYVIVAFTDVTAGQFVGRIEELEGVPVGFESGGAVAFSSVAYLLLAVAMGVVQRRLRPPLWLTTLVFVPATLGVVWLGTRFSTWLAVPRGSAATAQKAWGAGILGYCFVASILPVWLLLQPRGYLGGFVLYLVLAVGAVGILFGGHAIEQPAFRGFVATDPRTGAPSPDGLLFPFLFVTIACGACSGFHGLVCTGTTSKQVARETHCRPVGYGAMLLEAFVALVALTTVMIVASPSGSPGAVYGKGIGLYLTEIVGRENLLPAVVFGSMAFATFVFDTLDVCTRLGRYVLQELVGATSRASAAVATAATVGVPLVFVLASESGAYRRFWTLFGTSNQLLAGLTLLTVGVWLRRGGRACWYVLAPAAFVLGITVWALVLQAGGLWREGAAATERVNGGVSLLLLALAGVLLVEAARALRRPRAAPAAEAA